MARHRKPDEMGTGGAARGPALPKSPSGIRGLDEVTGGGLPSGRPTLVCGGPGCGKTLFAAEFLVRGAIDYGEPGVFIAFEEKAADLTANVASLGFDLESLVRRGQLYIDPIHIERSEIEEAGDYDLEGLFVRIGYAVDKIGAKRVAIDTLEALFSGFQNTAILRSELRRLFRWLKDRGLTAVITAERGDGSLTRYGLEEYVSDCVISLDHRVDSQISTRRLRIVKYRGSAHGTNEYPFLIDEGGFTVIPITAAGLAHEVSSERVPSGVPGLDEMLGGKGYYRGSTVLISGSSGTGKTIAASHFVKAACARGERALFATFEESPGQLIRNMRSVGVDLAPEVKKGLLRFHAARPTFYGLETHLARILRDVIEFEPTVVIVDPLSSLLGAASPGEVHALGTRLLDSLKERGVTALITTLTSSAYSPLPEATMFGLSSVVDTWILLRDLELNGERNRGLFVLKSRGMSHSNQIREFLITDSGVRLVDAYLGSEGVLTGSSRVAQEARSRAGAADRDAESARQQHRAARRRAAIEARIMALRMELEGDEAEMQSLEADQARHRTQSASGERDLARSRHVEVDGGAVEPARRRSARADRNGRRAARTERPGPTRGATTHDGAH
jgi:circadian clock protein KaiC